MNEFEKDKRIELVKKLSVSIVVFFMSFLAFDYLFLKINFRTCQLTEEDKTLKYHLIPLKECKITTREFSVDYKINKYGLRDIEFEKEKQSNQYRILFLGDSFIEGQGVQIEDTLVKKVERLLNQNAQSKNFQTINAGVAGYSTILEYLYLINKGINFSPELVILNISMNDFTEELANLTHARRDENGDITAVYIEQKNHLPESMEYFLKNNSFTYNLFLNQEENIFKLKAKIVAKISGREIPEYAKDSTDIVPGDINRDPFAITRDIDEQRFNQLFNPVSQRVLQVKSFLDTRNIQLVVVLVPNGHQIDKDQWSTGRLKWKLTKSDYPNRINEKLKEFAVNNNILFTDISAALKEYLAINPKSKLFYDYDGHFTKEGHEVSALSMYDFLQKNKTLLKID